MSIIITSLVIAPAVLSPQVGPYGLVNSSVGHTMTRVEAEDFDGDGWPDLVTTSSRDGRLVLYRGLGGGQFDIGLELERAPFGLFDARAHDVDADGVLDLVFSRVGGIAWKRGLGTGAFAPTAQLFATTTTADFELIDIDQDGRLDLALRDTAAIRIAWGTGPAQFAPGVVVSTTTTFFDALTFADLDGDGRRDLAATSASELIFVPNPVSIDGSLVVRLQTAPRTFATEVQLLAGPFRTSVLRSFDTDGDGDRDIVRAQAGSGELLLHRNDGGTVFTALPVPLATVPGITGLLVRDLDGDGDDDLVYAGDGQPSPGVVGELLQLGGGAFGAGAALTNVGTAPRGVDRADLDMDGREDLVHISTFDDTLLWHRSLVGGGYAPPVEVTDRFPLSSQPEPTFAIDDLDGDGGLDVVALAATVRIAERRPDGRFGRSVSTGLDSPVLELPTLADLDGDGDKDIVLVHWRSPLFNYELEWAPRVAGGFGPPATIEVIPSAVSYSGVAALDWDGDGDQDLVSGTYQPGQLRLHRNDGAGNFAPVQVIGQLPNLAVVPSVDLDGDGRSDLVYKSVNLPGVRTFTRRVFGNGQLGPQLEAGALVGALEALAWVDMDTDGDLDALRVESPNPSASGGDLALYENRGAAGFGPRLVLIADPAVGTYMRVQGVDWDMDGRQDLLVMDRSRRRVDVYLQTGPLQIGARQTLTTEMVEANGLRVADLDGDGDQDLVLADSSMKALRTFENLRTVGQSFCASLPNSTGTVAAASIAGSAVVAVDRTTLNASGMPTSSFGYFIASTTPAPTPVAGLNDGLLCLAGTIGRYNRPGEVRNSGVTGRFALTLELANTPSPTGSIAVVAGQTWHYQAWYRDANPTPTSNFTSGVSVTYQ